MADTTGLNVAEARGILIAMDGGGTRTRCAAFERNGRVLATAEGGPSNHLSTDRGRVLENLRDTVSRALEGCGAKVDDVALISAGFAGVDIDGRGENEMRALLRDAGFSRCLIHGDMVIAHTGALGGRPGVIVISGTGSVYFGRSPSGEQLKVGGFGYLFGDEGSGYWIARMGLTAASRAYDGRGPATDLIAAFCAAMNVKDFSGIPQSICGSEDPRVAISQLSRTVVDIASAGDPIACGILERAGDELTIGAETVIRRLKMDRHCEVSYHGTVLQQCLPVREHFQNKLRERMPGVVVTQPAGDSIAGARILGFQALQWELSNESN